MWAKMLARYSSEEIEFAFERWMETQRWMPKLPDISESINQLRKRKQEEADEKREQDLRAILKARRDAGEEFFSWGEIIQDMVKLAKEKREQREREYELKLDAAKKLARQQADVLIAKEQKAQ